MAKMAKLDTLFMTKMADKESLPFEAAHTCIALHKGVQRTVSLHALHAY